MVERIGNALRQPSFNLGAAIPEPAARCPLRDRDCPRRSKHGGDTDWRRDSLMASARGGLGKQCHALHLHPDFAPRHDTEFLQESCFDARQEGCRPDP